MASFLLAVIYLSFISLGLPDAILGAAWPVMEQELQVPTAWAGVVSMIICLGTVVSSLQSDRLTKKLGAGRVTCLSVALTAMALAGFSCSTRFWMLCLWAVPYGLGAGSVDAAVNNYAALHYSSRHMSWLHCMWGLGASTGPVIMGAVLTRGLSWSVGYRAIAAMQVVLTLLLLLSLPLWQRSADRGGDARRPLSLGEVLSLPGAKEVVITFCCYCGLETTAGLWASTYLVACRGLAEELAASWAGWFYTGITLGRGLGGFLTAKLGDDRMVRLGFWGIGLGLAVVLLPVSPAGALVGLVLTGLGCAPIYPSLIHATPAFFGPERSQAVIGVQMAGAYVGSSFAPPLLGFLGSLLGMGVYPVYLLALLAVMARMYFRLLRITGRTPHN